MPLLFTPHARGSTEECSGLERANWFGFPHAWGSTLNVTAPTTGVGLPHARGIDLSCKFLAVRRSGLHA